MLTFHKAEYVGTVVEKGNNSVVNVMHL